MADIRGLYAPLIGNNLKICMKDGKKIVPLFHTMRSMQMFLELTHGLSTGAFAISRPENFLKSIGSKGIKIVIITWHEGIPKAEEVPNEFGGPNTASEETSSESGEDPLTFHETK